jgi:hypothetical protein
MPTTWIDPGPLTLTATLQRSEESGTACFVDVPWDLKTTFGKGNLVPVVAVWDERVPYRGSLAKRGGPCAMLLCRTDVLTALGKAAGDTVHVCVTLDTAPREVDVPDDLGTALAANTAAKAVWEAFAPSCRRAYVQWIEEAKRPETRARRVAAALEGIAAGRRR